VNFDLFVGFGSQFFRGSHFHRNLGIFFHFITFALDCDCLLCGQLVSITFSMNFVWSTLFLTTFSVNLLLHFHRMHVMHFSNLRLKTPSGHFLHVWQRAREAQTRLDALENEWASKLASLRAERDAQRVKRERVLAELDTKRRALM
jgi:hypothetical protein